MAQTLVLIHGRSTKPAQKMYENLQRQALIDGLMRADPAKAAKVEDGTVRLELVYYGDVNNEILSEDNARVRKKLTAKDPDNGNLPCEPGTGLSTAIKNLRDFKNFSKSEYRKVLKKNRDLRWLDDAARAVSTLAGISTATILNMQVISKATADMGAYLMTRKVGSKVRDRLQRPLKAAIERDDDICLVSHSMGCMVSYDVLWKFSNMSEYSHLRRDYPTINKWITLGCPLGEAGVKRNLYDGDERGQDRFPRHIINDWANIAARDDFVAHDATMRNDFGVMKRYGYVNSISDKRIYNCYAAGRTSNPHKLYGYLAHDATGRHIADWIA